MLPVPAWWGAAVTSSHRRLCRVDVTFGGDIVAANVAVESGTVVMDRAAQVRGRIDLVLAEPLLLPNDAYDPLAPFGAELVVQLGAVNPSTGEQWMVPWGVFGIQTSRASWRNKTATLTGLDRFQAASDASLSAELAIAAGTNYVTAIQTLLLAAKPDLTFRTVETTFTTPKLVVGADVDPVAKAVEMGLACGCEVYMAHDGVCEIALEPTPADPVATVAVGATGVLVDLDLTLDRADAVNQVIVTGNNTSTATKVQGVATDTNPASPTAWDGPFGRKPVRVSSALATTNASALADATARLARSRGVPSWLDVAAVPNAAIVCSDAIQVTAGNLVDSIHVIDRISMPVGPAGGATRYGTRKVLVG